MSSDIKGLDGDTGLGRWEEDLGFELDGCLHVLHVFDKTLSHLSQNADFANCYIFDSESIINTILTIL